MNSTLTHNIRHLMRIKYLSVAEVARRANLSRYQVDNVLYNRSQNINNIQKIAQALDTPLDDLFDAKLISPYNTDSTYQISPIVKNKGNINPDDYVIIINCCKELLSEYDTKLSKEDFEKWVNVLYVYKAMSGSRTELKNMAKGILFYLLEYNEKTLSPNVLS